MTEAELAAIEARANAATLGPWDNGYVPIDHEGQAVWPWYEKADMDFAYAARTDVPALCAALRAALAENTRVEKELNELKLHMSEEIESRNAWRERCLLAEGRKYGA